MPGINDSLVSVVSQGLCNITALSGAQARLGSRLWRSLGAEAVGAGGQALADSFGAASDLFCGRPPRRASDDVPVPFTGGQCDGVIYDLFVNYLEGGSGVSTNRAVGLVGPVSGYRFDLREIPNPPFSPVFSLRVGNSEGLASDPGLGDAPDGVLFSRVTSNGLEAIDFGFFRRDGLPDDCGNPGLEPPDFNPSEFNPTLTFPLDDGQGNQVSINAPVQFGPAVLDIDNNFSIPVSIEFAPGVQINGDLNLSTGDLNIGGGDDGGAPSEIPEQEPIPEGSVLVGVRVVVSESVANDSKATKVRPPSSLVDIYLPRLAAVRFNYNAEPRAGLGDSISCQSLNNVIWAERPALSFDITPSEGVTYQAFKIVMPVRRFFTGVNSGVS